MINFEGSMILKNVVGRCNVWETYQQVIYYAISRLALQFNSYRQLTTPEKASFVKEAIRLHKKNRTLYTLVNQGTYTNDNYDCPIHGLQDGPDCPRC